MIGTKPMHSVRLTEHQGRVLKLVIKGDNKRADQRQNDMEQHKRKAYRTGGSRYQILENASRSTARCRAVTCDHGHHFLVYIVRSFGLASMVNKSAARFTQT